MLKIPTCYMCQNYDFNKNACPAYPEGIPQDVRISKKYGSKESCGRDIKFVPKRDKE